MSGIGRSRTLSRNTQWVATIRAAVYIASDHLSVQGKLLARSTVEYTPTNGPVNPYFGNPCIIFHDRHTGAMKTAHQIFLEACRTRRDKMRAMQKKGKTLEQIGAKFGITRQRAGQILNGKGEAK